MKNGGDCTVFRGPFRGGGGDRGCRLVGGRGGVRAMGRGGWWDDRSRGRGRRWWSAWLVGSFVTGVARVCGDVRLARACGALEKAGRWLVGGGSLTRI